jgi:plastocyanin
MWAGSGHDVTSGTVSGGVGTPDNKFCNQNNTDCANAPLENAGNTYSFVFTTAGSYSYYCRPHASFGMTGTITVQ